MNKLIESTTHIEMDHYGGSHAFTWLAELTGLRLDLVNFLICQITALFLASLYRSVLHPSKVSSHVRHMTALLLGICFGYFCFGPQAVHIVGLPSVCYIVIRTQHPLVVQRYVLIVAMAYLLSIHLIRLLYEYKSEALDITAPLMIITQKVTSLAFSIHDGLAKPTQELTKTQQYYAVRKIPSTLEYFSYVLHFHGLLAGPVVFYSDYIDFVEGTNLLKHSGHTVDKNRSMLVLEPSPIKTVVKKVFGSLICALIFVKFSKLYPVKKMKEDDFIESTSLLYKLWYTMLSTTFTRFKYYHAWLLADAICNNSNLGFAGYDKDGNANWDLISNINVFGFEFATNIRDAINNWNCGTNRWLRCMVYERTPRKYGTILTFTLSAVWHGFYPGYYLTFATGALMVTSARTARRLFRYRFQGTQLTRMLYDVITCLTTRIIMGYTTFPFVMLEFMGSVKLYLKFYLCLHILALSTIYILPKLIESERRQNAATSFSSNSLDQTTSTTLREKADENPDIAPSMTLNDTNLSKDLKDQVNVRRISVELDNTNGFRINPNTNVYELRKRENGGGLRLQQQQSEQQLKQAPPVCDIIRDQCEMEQLSSKLMEKLEAETKNIEDFIDKTVTETVSGIVEFKRDLMRDFDGFKPIVANGNINNGNINTADGDGVGNLDTNSSIFSKTVSSSLVLPSNSVDENQAFLKKEIDAINAVVQQANVLPAVLSNGHAK